MAILRRLFGIGSSEDDTNAKQERERQYEEVSRGLREAEQRLRFIEVEAELQSRKFFRDNQG